MTTLEAEANARLIAASRDLLEALKALSAGMWAGDGVTRPRVRGADVAKARSAIAKAEAQISGPDDQMIVLVQPTQLM